MHIRVDGLEEHVEWFTCPRHRRTLVPITPVDATNDTLIYLQVMSKWMVFEGFVAMLMINIGSGHSMPTNGYVARTKNCN